MSAFAPRKPLRRYVIAGPDWQAALLAMLAAERFPDLAFATACAPAGPEHELEAFVHAELSPRLMAMIADAVIREWPSFVIAGGGLAQTVTMTAGVFDPSQMVASAAQALPRVPPQAAHWQPVNSDIVWIDVGKLWADPRLVTAAPPVRSRWLDWTGFVDLKTLVLADFSEDPARFHRQYLPLTPSQIFARRVDHGSPRPALAFHGDPGTLALDYMRSYPSQLGHMSQVSEAAFAIIDDMQRDRVG